MLLANLSSFARHLWKSRANLLVATGTKSLVEAAIFVSYQFFRARRGMGVCQWVCQEVCACDPSGSDLANKMKSMIRFFQRTSCNTLYHKNKTLLRIAQPLSNLATLRGAKCFIFLICYKPRAHRSCTNLNLLLCTSQIEASTSPPGHFTPFPCPGRREVDHHS